MLPNQESLASLSSTPTGAPKSTLMPDVLIVDQSHDNREVLRTVLQRHGYRTLEAERKADGLRLVRECQPQVLVLDAETIDAASPSACADFNNEATAGNASILLLGKTSTSRKAMPGANVIAKPYHYGPLIRRIEELLVRAERKF